MCGEVKEFDVISPRYFPFFSFQITLTLESPHTHTYTDTHILFSVKVKVIPNVICLSRR